MRPIGEATLDRSGRVSFAGTVLPLPCMAVAEMRDNRPRAGVMTE